MSSARVPLLIATTALVLAACGGSNTPGATRSSTSPIANPSLPTSTTGGTATTTGGSTTRPRTPGSTGTARPPATVTATLDRTCVRRGVSSDTQGITVRTKPGHPVGYVTTYSDGSSIIDHPEYSSGGQDSGFAGGDGVYRDTWVVPSPAPTGPATVHINAGSETPTLTFTVVERNGSCP